MNALNECQRIDCVIRAFARSVAWTFIQLLVVTQPLSALTFTNDYLRISAQSNDKLCARLSANYFKSSSPVPWMNDYFSQCINQFSISSSNVFAHVGLGKLEYEVMKLVNNKFTYLNKLLMGSWCRKIIRKQHFSSSLSATILIKSARATHSTNRN